MWLMWVRVISKFFLDMLKAYMDFHISSYMFEDGLDIFYLSSIFFIFPIVISTLFNSCKRNLNNDEPFLCISTTSLKLCSIMLFMLLISMRGGRLLGMALFFFFLRKPTPGINDRNHVLKERATVIEAKKNTKIPFYDPICFFSFFRNWDIFIL